MVEQRTLNPCVVGSIPTTLTNLHVCYNQNMIKGMESLCIWSENYRELANWYRDILELEVESELDIPRDTGVNFNINGFFLWIGQHDGVKGKNKDQFRFMPGFDVDDVTETYNKLSAKGVEFIQTPIVSPTEDYRVATAKDPDGNIIQFFSD